MSAIATKTREAKKTGNAGPIRAGSGSDWADQMILKRTFRARLLPHYLLCLHFEKNGGWRGIFIRLRVAAINSSTAPSIHARTAAYPTGSPADALQTFTSIFL
jgi:hypothetical protein